MTKITDRQFVYWVSVASIFSIDFQNIIFSFITILYYNIIIFETAARKFSIFVPHMRREEAVLPLMINALGCWCNCQLM